MVRQRAVRVRRVHTLLPPELPQVAYSKSLQRCPAAVIHHPIERTWLAKALRTWSTFRHVLMASKPLMAQQPSVTRDDLPLLYVIHLDYFAAQQ